MMHWVWTVLIGFVARAITLGKSPSGFIMTAVLGVAGSVLASLIGQALGCVAILAAMSKLTDPLGTPNR